MKKILIILLAFGLFSHALCAEQTTPAPAQETTVTSVNKAKQIVTIVTTLAKRLSINSGLCVAANPALSAAVTISSAISIILFLGWLLILLSENGVLLIDEVIHKIKFGQDMFVVTSNELRHKVKYNSTSFQVTKDENPHPKFILQEENYLRRYYYFFFVPGFFLIMMIKWTILEKKILNEIVADDNENTKKFDTYAFNDQQKSFLVSFLLSVFSIMIHLAWIVFAIIAVPALTAILLAFIAPVGIAIDTLLAFTAYKNIPAIKNKNLGVVLIHEFKNIVAKIKASITATIPVI